MTALSLGTPGTAARRPLRWLALLALSVLLHWIALTMTTEGFGSLGPPAARRPQVMTATLSASPAARPAASEASVAAPASPEPVKPLPPGKRGLRPKAPAATPANPAPAAAENATAAMVPAAGEATALTSAPSLPPGAAGNAAVETDVGATAIPKAEAAPAAQPTAATPQVGDVASTERAPRYTVNLPPAVSLEYEVRYATRGNITRGSSKIDWQPTEGGYAIRGEVTKFGFALSSFRSEGAIDDAGIAPTLYAEKNARRSETNTHFQRKAAPVISFSAATDTFPLLTGAQDRASILWQLSGIARGDRQAFVPGAVLDVFVAGVRDAEHWLINIIGEETVTLDTGEARAWHLVRTPRAGTYDKRIDIWLAPEQQWYPVKLRYTEVNGDYLDLSLATARPANTR